MRLKDFLVLFRLLTAMGQTKEKTFQYIFGSDHEAFFYLITYLMDPKKIILAQINEISKMILY
jgi:hypothetical protein